MHALIDTTLEHWTRVTLAALDAAQVDPERQVPLWVAHFGLENLGAGSLRTDVQGRLMVQLRSVLTSPLPLGEAELETLQRDGPWKGTSDQLRIGVLVLNPVASPAAVWTARPTAGLLAIARSGSAKAAFRMLTAAPIGNGSFAAEQPSADPSPEQMSDLARSASVTNTDARLWVAARGTRTSHVPAVHDPQGPDDVLRALPVSSA